MTTMPVYLLKLTKDASQRFVEWRALFALPLIQI
jgi:hypothetical protein